MSLSRRALSFAIVAGAALIVSLSSGEAAWAGCPHETEASPGFRSFLPDCRAYELVTPPYVGGQPALGVGRGAPPMSADGEHILAIDFAGLAGTENDENFEASEYGAIYEFSRTPSGWSTESLEPPASQYPRRAFVSGSADLSRSLWELAIPSKEGEEIAVPMRGSLTLAVRESTPGGRPRFTAVGPTVSPEHETGKESGYVTPGISSDLSHILLGVRSERKQLWPGDTTREGATSLYEYVGTGNREPVLVGVKNAGALQGKPYLNEGAKLVSECGTILGSNREGTTYNAISTNGAVVYFTALHGACSTPAVNELYARVNGAQTVAVSEPAMTPEREEECSGVCREDEQEESKRSPALFEGASENGAKVFFTTEQPLLNGDEDNKRDLYEAEIEGGAVKRLVQVSHDPTKGQAGEVVTVVRGSPDGSHVYYVAKGMLTTEPNGNGEGAEEGAYNLYEYDTHSERTAFVAKLLTRSEIEEIEASEEVVEKKTEIKEEKVTIEAKKTEISTTMAEIKARIAECKTERAKGEVTLAEECEVKVGEEEATLVTEQSELTNNGATLAAEEEELVERIGRRTGFRREDNGRPFETTPNGRFLVFTNARPLTASDKSTVAQVFEYDAQTKSLVRVSIGQKGSYLCPSTGKVEEGYDCNGNTTNSGDTPTIVGSPPYLYSTYPTYATSHLSLSEDGAVFFASADGLTPGAVDNHRKSSEVGGIYTENVYEFREGNVYLISPGDEAVTPPVFGSRLLGTDESGGDVFFFSSDSLVPQDTDTQASWYDARVGGGFPAPVSPAGCEGEACQGSLSATPSLTAANSTTAEGGNLAPPVSKPVVTPLTRPQKLAKALKACRAKHNKRKRASCETQAQQKYGSAHRAKTRRKRK
jgi:hypothetical protein